MRFSVKKKIDQNFICSHTKSSSRVFSETSTLTEDQGRIDITYYKIDFEIDFNSEQILGSVIANGFVGMDQPDYIEFDKQKIVGRLIRIPKLSDVPYPVQMEPNLVVEFYSR